MAKPFVASLADALVSELNLEFSPADFTATRSWQPKRKVEDLDTLQVAVAPRSRGAEFETRSHDFCRHVLDVSFLVKVPADKDTDALVDAFVDDQAALVEEVADHVAGLKRLTVGADSHLLLAPPAIEPVCDRAMLLQERLFFSILSCQYRERRAVR